MWFRKRTDLTSHWEEDGDLSRIKSFFKAIQLNSEGDEQIKHSIKQKALKKMVNEEEEGELPVTVRQELLLRIRTRLRMMLGHRPWKLGISILGITIFILIGQGITNGSFNLLPRLGSTEQSMDMAVQTPRTIGPDSEMSKGGVTNDSMKAKEDATSQSTSSNSTSSAKNMVVPSLPVSPDQKIVPPADSSVPRKITHDLILTLEVAAINDTVVQIDNQVQQLGGYVVESQQNGPDSQSSARLILKIPADKLYEFRDSLVTWGKILDQHMIANDITNQYYDFQVHLQTLEAEEKRYLEILNQAKTVEDVLKIENALGNIRRQIEQLKGQLKLWNHMVDYSTVKIQIITHQSPNLEVKNPWQPISWSNTWQATKDAVLKTLSNSWNALNYLVVGLGYALPYLLIGALGWGSYRKRKKRK
ncbi:MAG: DUF4349 domain-containing protein [Desulfosporosinus sp.]|jgi:hypothetical protein